MIFLRLAALAVVGLIAVEIALRLFMGPAPLSMAHDRIEYLFQPNQDVTRFGNRQVYNSQSMRNSGEPADFKRHIYVFGDSVLNGGVPTAQADLATERVASARDGVFVANISAGSWGPPNQLAWAEVFGIGRPEAVILVLSSHDATDAPTFAPLDPRERPTAQAPIKIVEAVRRYLPRFLPGSDDAEPAGADGDSGDTLDAILGLLDLAASAGAKTCILHHPTREEFGGTYGPEFETIRAAAQQADRFVEGKDYYDAPAASLYRDNIHLTGKAGQAALARALEACLSPV